MSFNRFRIPAMVLAFAAPVAGEAPLATAVSVANASDPNQETPVMKTHPYAGMWVTADGYIRHELLPNGRYDEARGRKQSAYRGSYTITGNHIDYVDDTGFTADGEFVDGVLYHAGMVLYRED
ncbi:protein Atu4866 [Pseudoxanthomonas sp. CF125]|nr:protein Atu4866 [Pseudoxanthomonas sp. CF125]